MQQLPARREDFEAFVISNAAYFTAFLRKGPHFTAKTEHATRGEAEAAAQALANEHGRAAMVYAVTEAGRSTHVCNIPPRKA